MGDGASQQIFLFVKAGFIWFFIFCGLLLLFAALHGLRDLSSWTRG